MISLLAPLASVLLAALPILWWLHRRTPRPGVVRVPSLMFLEDEAPEPPRSARPRPDADLWLALGAAGALALAAAGPVLGGTEDGRRVLILIDDASAMAARSADGTTGSDRARAVAEGIRRRVRGADRLETVSAQGDELRRRARASSVGLRILVSDRRPRDLPVGVVFVGVGDPAATNAGIVSIDVDVVAGRRRAFATIWNDATTGRVLRAGPIGAETEVACPPFGAARASWDLGPSLGGGRAAPSLIHLLDEGGALALDDRVTLDASPMRVAFARGGLSPAVEAATRRALDAILVGGWVEDPSAAAALFVGPMADVPSGASVVLEIARVPPGVEPVRPSATDVVTPPDPDLARDLDLAAADWLYTPGAGVRAPWPRISVERVASRTRVRWHADPSLGRPRAIDTALWPLFVENVVRLVGGVPGPGGHRWQGVLDADVTRLGRDAVPFDEAALADAPRDLVARTSPLGPWCGGLGTICLGLLWFRPRKGPASPVR